MTDDEALAGLFSQLNDINPEVEDLSKLTTPELAERRDALDRRLSELDQLLELNPHSQEARDLHSERGAVIIELRKRGM